MLNFITKNLATIIVLIALLIVVGTVIVKMLKDKKKGKSSCGGNCAGCPMACACHQKSSKAPQIDCKKH